MKIRERNSNKPTWSRPKQTNAKSTNTDYLIFADDANIDITNVNDTQKKCIPIIAGVNMITS